LAASDYGEITRDAWLYLQATYTGGPTIPNTDTFFKDGED